MAQKPLGPSDLECPFHRKLMNKVCHKCPLWVKLQGKNPQTGGLVDEWDCSVAWLPILLIENAQETRQGAAATESFRNEMVKAAGQVKAERTLLPTAGQNLTRRIGGDG